MKLIKNLEHNCSQVIAESKPYFRVDEDENLYRCNMCEKLLGVDISLCGSAYNGIPFGDIIKCPTCDNFYCSIKCMKPIISYNAAHEFGVRHDIIDVLCTEYFRLCRAFDFNGEYFYYHPECGLSSIEIKEDHLLQVLKSKIPDFTDDLVHKAVKDCNELIENSIYCAECFDDFYELEKVEEPEELKSESDDDSDNDD